VKTKMLGQKVCDERDKLEQHIRALCDKTTQASRVSKHTPGQAVAKEVLT
jgi:hypothetical protein